MADTLALPTPAQRVANDHYPTPRWMTECLLDHAEISGTVAELCCGQDQAIIHVLRRHSEIDSVTASDFYFGDRRMDATDPNTYAAVGEHDWFVTNPPFNCQQEIIRHSWANARTGVAMLLRVSADEMTMGDSDRYNWWADHPPSLMIKIPRFAFVRSVKSNRYAVDSAYCHWVVWRKDGHRYPSPFVYLPHDRIDGFTRSPAS